MKRLHVHVTVPDLAQSIRFYSTLFGANPSKQESDYAKWMLDDPRINFAISSRGLKVGVDHLGFQVDADDELAELRAAVGKAEIAALDQPDAACCYAKSDEYWITDPQGIAWETFRTLGDIPVYGAQVAKQETGACCAPQPQTVAFVKRKAPAAS